MKILGHVVFIVAYYEVIFGEAALCLKTSDQLQGSSCILSLSSNWAQLKHSRTTHMFSQSRTFKMPSATDMAQQHDEHLVCKATTEVCFAEYGLAEGNLRLKGIREVQSDSLPHFVRTE
jgi:hypothetical protein